MRTFTIQPNGFKAIKKQTLLRTLPIVFAGLIAGFVTSMFNTNSNPNDVNTLPFVLPVIAIYASIGLYRGVNKQKALFESYTLHIDNNLITRKQLNTPAIAIYFNEIQKIVQMPNGSIAIHGKHADEVIGIPAQIDHYDELKTLLQSIHPITTTHNLTLLQRYPAITALLAIVLLVCVYTVTNKIIVGIAGSVLSCFMVWSLVKIYNTKQLDRKTKNRSWWILLVLASVIGVTLIKLLV